MSRRTLIILGIIVVLVVVGAGAFFFWQQSNAQRAATATRQTATLSRGELVANVSGAGNISAPQQTTLSFGTGGVPVTKVNVKVGDAVKQGQVLAEEDATQLSQQVKIAESNLASAKAKLAALTPNDQQIALAQAQVKSAQTAYDAAVAKMDVLKQPPAATDLAAAQAQLASAQSSYNDAVAKNNLSNDQITVARAALENSRVTLEAAQAAYNLVAWRDNATSSTQAKDLQTATINYEAAQSTYNLALQAINDTAVKSAASSLAQAKSNLYTVTKPPTADTLASAQSAIDGAAQTLMQAQQSLKQLQSGTLQSDQVTAQAAVDTAQADLDQAKHAVDQSQLVAPFDGTVATVNIVVGQTVTTSVAAITLVNTADLETQVSLSEVDVAQVKAGQDVQLTFDALGGRSVPGKVVAVSPLPTVTQGVVNYTVNITLTNPDPAILPGMSAQASIITARVPDALLAPNRAVRTQGNRRMMTVLFEGRDIPVFVQTGLINDTSTQILSATTADGQAVNLQDGDTVVLNATTTTNNNRGFGGGGGGPVFVPFGR